MADGGVQVIHFNLNMNWLTALVVSAVELALLTLVGGRGQLVSGSSLDRPPLVAELVHETRSARPTGHNFK